MKTTKSSDIQNPHTGPATLTKTTEAPVAMNKFAYILSIAMLGGVLSIVTGADSQIGNAISSTAADAESVVATTPLKSPVFSVSPLESATERGTPDYR